MRRYHWKRMKVTYNKTNEIGTKAATDHPFVVDRDEEETQMKRGGGRVKKDMAMDDFDSVWICSGAHISSQLLFL